jgi:hypothetical protein
MDERTLVLNLPLPHPEHLLSDDVLRIRAALTLLDAGFGQQRSEVQGVLDQQRSDMDAALHATTAAVAGALDELSVEVARRLRLLRLNQLLNLNL